MHIREKTEIDSGTSGKCRNVSVRCRDASLRRNSDKRNGSEIDVGWKYAGIAAENGKTGKCRNTAGIRCIFGDLKRRNVSNTESNKRVEHMVAFTKRLCYDSSVAESSERKCV